MTAKLRGRIAGIWILLAAFASANGGYNLAPAEAHTGSDWMISSVLATGTLTAAEAEARAHLDRFLAEVTDAEGRARPDAAVKVAVLVDGNLILVWVTPFVRLENRFIGALLGRPDELSHYRAGDAIAFSRDQVRDWYFFGQDGQMYGNFTARILLTALDPARSAAVAGLLSETALPATW